MKKTIYVLATIFLTLMLSFILHGLFEMAYINYAISNEKEIIGTYFLGVGWCALPMWVQYSLPILGIVGGYFWDNIGGKLFIFNVAIGGSEDKIIKRKND